MNKAEQKAVDNVPACVDLDQLDGTFSHVVFRVEHVVQMCIEGQDSYTQAEGRKCMRWLRRYAAWSEYADAIV